MKSERLFVNKREMRIVSFKIEEELLMKLDVHALNRRLSRSDVIREALEKYLKEAAGGT